MGQRGPPPTPTKTLRDRGSWRAKQRVDEPQFRPEKPQCPNWLSKRGKKTFRDLASDLAEVQLLAKSDALALALLADAIDQYLEARETVDREGLTCVTDKGNVIQHPAVSQRGKAWDRALRALREFGLTPSSRSTVKVLERKPRETKDKSILKL